MNAPISQDQASEYRAVMQSAAQAFLERHQAEHLGDEQTLFNRAITHLQRAMEVPQYLAETLVARAYGDLRSAGQRMHMDVSASSSSTAVITDPASGMTYAVPVALIVRHLIANPLRRTLRAVG